MLLKPIQAWAVFALERFGLDVIKSTEFEIALPGIGAKFIAASTIS